METRKDPSQSEQLTIFRNNLPLSTSDSDHMHVDRVSNNLENQCFYIIHHHPITIATSGILNNVWYKAYTTMNGVKYIL